MSTIDQVLGLIGSLPATLPDDPMPIFKKWYDEALAARKVNDPDAMALATSTPDGVPSCRIVLCKGVDAQRGAVRFYTNYDGFKGRQLALNPRAAAAINFDATHRQVRVEGVVVKCSPEESDRYFASRAVLSRLGAWASRQSEPLAARSELVERVREIMARFNISLLDLAKPPASVSIPRPPNWGGFNLWATRVELWEGVGGRLHDRAEWRRDLIDGYDPAAGPTDAAPRFSPWRATRLNP